MTWELPDNWQLFQTPAVTAAPKESEMERRFVIKEAWEDQLGILRVTGNGTLVTEKELRARLDAIIELRVEKGGWLWTWKKAIEILTQGVSYER